MSMEPLAHAGAGVSRPGAQRGLGVKGLALLGGLLATIAAIGIGAVLAVFFAATMVVLSVLAFGLVAAGSIAYRARQALRRDQEGQLLEARHIGGHSWVAYSWDHRGR